MIDEKNVHNQMLQDGPEYARDYDALEQEFAFIKKMIRARKRAGMSQADVARRMGISQPRVAKIESGSNISLDILRRYARATGSDLVIDFAVPVNERRTL
ncbi:MAG: XRE family transcriptional regulator [Proteobacteria bacterium]|nr:XRE family transcriptional regulator [Pseudomonadota bacterium]